MKRSEMMDITYKTVIALLHSGFCYVRLVDFFLMYTVFFLV